MVEISSPFQNDKQRNLTTKKPKAHKPRSKTVISNHNISQSKLRKRFHHLFQHLPHRCVMDKHCHLYLSDAPYFTNKTMIVVGMVRDSEKDLAPVLQQLDEISCIFNKIVFVIYESNSNDNTPLILKHWQTLNLNASHCKHFQINPQMKHQSNRTLSVTNHRPTLIKKVLFHDFVDVRGKNRIVRFIIFRNMILQKIREISNELGIDNFDYVTMIDLDIKEFDIKALFRDLHESPFDILCSNGLFKLNIMRDTFASIMTNGTWLYTYHSLYDDHFQDLIDWPHTRYQAMHSCFGGLAVYKDSQRLLQTQCKYVILEELYKEYEYSKVFQNKTGKQREWKESDRWFLNGTYREPLVKLLHMFQSANRKVKKERRKICEHLAYHYCLRAHGYDLGIARDIAVYYFDFATMQNNNI